MSILTIAAQVSGTSPLNLNDRTNFRVVGMSWGGRQWRHVTQQSDFVHGELTIASLLNKLQQQMVVRALGSTQTALENNLAALETYFSQHDYTVSGTRNGVNFSWVHCDPADLEPGEGGLIHKFQMARYMQEVTIKIPCAPLGGDGPFA